MLAIRSPEDSTTIFSDIHEVADSICPVVRLPLNMMAPTMETLESMKPLLHDPMVPKSEEQEAVTVEACSIWQYISLSLSLSNLISFSAKQWEFPSF